MIRENPGLFIFDINSAIAGMLWKDAALWRMQKKNLSVVLYGGSDLAGCILSTGVLLNLFSPEQQIQYHNIGANPFAVRHSGFLTGNGDTIRFLSKKEEAIWEIIRHGDIVIVAEELPISELQSVLVNCRNAKQVYYYSRFDGDYGDLVHLPELKPFGRETEIYTDENIRKEALIQDAVELNRQYTVQNHAETDWNKLSGFLKCSNISAADYRRVLEELLKQPNPPATEALAELEHIRWCRFHYLNYWSYGIPENGKTKDARKKIHSCLRPYKKLSKEEQEKDLRFIRELKAGETV